MNERSATLSVEVEPLERPKGRARLWKCVVSTDGREVFASRTVAIRLREERAARWLGELVAGLMTEGLSVPTAVHTRDGVSAWEGDLDDDCWLDAGHCSAHAEWMDGPRRGGVWYCSVRDRDGTILFSTVDFRDIQPKSGVAARWLCEHVIQASEVGTLRPRS